MTIDTNDEIISEAANFLHDERRLFVEAEAVAHRMRFNGPVLDFLYERSRVKLGSKKEWTRSVLIANATDKLIQTSFPGFGLGRLDGLLNQDAVRQIVDKMHAPRGAILMTFHGAYVHMAKKLFPAKFKEGLLFARGGQIIGAGSNPGDSREALFMVLRALQDGKALFIAPDGRNGRQSAVVKVFGTATSIGEGAAYLAHASGCRTAFYTVVRRGDEFIPVVELGPEKAKGESFEMFQHRLFEFYGQQIEAAYVGDPINIVFRPRWIQVLKAKALGLPIPPKLAAGVVTA